MNKLTEAEISKHLESAKTWDRVGDMIVRTWQFAAPRRSREFAVRVHELAEQKGQEPEIVLKDRFVRVELSTHASGGITQADFDFAAMLETIPADR